MCARKNKKSCWPMLFLTLSFLTLSCSTDDSTTTYNDYCYIKSVTLGTVKRTIEKCDRKDRTQIIGTTTTTFSGSAFAMTIDQRNNTIENRDSLPYGSQLSAVLATISFDGSLLKYREKGSAAEWTAYNSTDSLNLTKPLELHLTSNDSNSSRIYTFKVNVHQQEGDSLYWNKCDDDNITLLAGMTDIKAFVLNDKLMVLGKKETEIALVERSGLEAQGIWESKQCQHIINEANIEKLPLSSDLQTLCQHNDTLYLSTNDGKILYSIDAKDWKDTATIHTAGLTLIEKTDKYFYAISISEGKILRHYTDEDNIKEYEWKEDCIDTDATKLPISEIRALTMQQANGNSRIVMVGQVDVDGVLNAVVWNKMWNETEKEENTEWTYFPISPDNKIPCPRLYYFNLLPYDGNCIAFGGASVDESHKALDAMFISQDYGITWRTSTELHMPIQLEGIEGCITSTVDKNNFIWIITNAQVWRGRLNRLGFAQQ